MNRGTNPLKSVANDEVICHAAFVGAGAANMTLATAAQYPKIANLGLTCVRTSIGLYVVTLADGPTQMLDIAPHVKGPTGLECLVKVDYSATLRTLTINFWNKANPVALADPQTTDLLVLTFFGRNSAA